MKLPLFAHCSNACTVAMWLTLCNGLFLAADGCPASAQANLSILHSFGDGSVVNDGKYSSANLIQGSDGNFYGTTMEGGVASSGSPVGEGAVFKMTPAGAVTILHSFGDGTVANDGAYPYSSLVQGSDGNFYGTTSAGGSADQGAVFRMTPAGVMTILHSFLDGTVPNDGADPETSLIQGRDGNFYGVTTLGGSKAGSNKDTAGQGTVFRLTPAGAVTILHSFGDETVANDGFDAIGGLIQGADGNFYGTTFSGGTTSGMAPTGYGVVFRMTPSGTVTILHLFGDGTVPNDGKNPRAALISGRDGNFYGTTEEGGAAGEGAVFRMTPAGVVTILHSFGDGSVANEGTYPSASLVLSNDGNFYGTTVSGGTTGNGTSGYGTVFKMTPDGVATVLHSFEDGSVVGDGKNPEIALLQSRDGKLYGVTGFGGSQSFGTLFRFALSHTHLLWAKTDGTASLWTINTDNSYSHAEYGPYSGWMARAVADAPDGSVWLLWTSANGAASLWNVTNGSYTHTEYGPYASYAAVSLSVGSDGSPRLLWNKNDGTALLWTVNPVSGSFTYATYGPFSGWDRQSSCVGCHCHGLALDQCQRAGSGLAHRRQRQLSHSCLRPLHWLCGDFALCWP